MRTTLNYDIKLDPPSYFIATYHLSYFDVDKITIMTIREPSPSPAEAEETSLSKAEQQSRWNNSTSSGILKTTSKNKTWISLWPKSLSLWKFQKDHFRVRFISSLYLKDQQCSERGWLTLRRDLKNLVLYIIYLIEREVVSMKETIHIFQFLSDAAKIVATFKQNNCHYIENSTSWNKFVCFSCPHQ